MKTPQPANPVIEYTREQDLDVDEFIALLQNTTLGERRPLSDRPRMATMLANGSIIMTARCRGELVGVSRALTDYAYCTYLSDLAVAESHQGQGIGKELIRQTHETAGLNTMLILLAAPDAETYYPHIGMTNHHSCWFIPRRS
ncbi:MAG: GNAT family N-acetyltransferase [Planctomycetaceae bacterium]|nr:GNAT family N-acetyltransferase [Planctomycetaceae bacterium]